MQRLGVDVGDMLEVEGKRRTVCRVLPTFKEHRGKEHLQIDGVVRENARVGLDEVGRGPPDVGQAGGRAAAGRRRAAPLRAAT